ncbi:MAG TPA: hypothetical protein VIM58_11100 [Candidatus Methylacidiphilales bacterium]
MRRDLNWTTKRADGSKYEVRVVYFGKKFEFQFREKTGRTTTVGKSGRKEEGLNLWDHKRAPERADLEELVAIMERYHPRHRATDEELAESRRMLADFDRRNA